MKLNFFWQVILTFNDLEWFFSMFSGNSISKSIWLRLLKLSTLSLSNSGQDLQSSKKEVDTSLAGLGDSLNTRSLLKISLSKLSQDKLFSRLTNNWSLPSVFSSNTSLSNCFCWLNMGKLTCWSLSGWSLTIVASLNIGGVLADMPGQITCSGLQKKEI